MLNIYCANTGGENNELNDSCNIKFQKYSHPDLHFIYPTVTTDAVKTKPKSIDFIADWRQFITQNPYGGLFEWYDVLGVQNKQGRNSS
jgi:DNA polymerase-3 subunit delta'